MASEQAKQVADTFGDIERLADAYIGVTDTLDRYMKEARLAKAECERLATRVAELEEACALFGPAYEFKTLPDKVRRIFLERDEALEDASMAVGEGDKYRLALESLTPQGSEYVRNPERCVAYVRDRNDIHHRQILDATKRQRELERSLDQVRGRARALAELAVQMAGVPMSNAISALDAVRMAATAFLASLEGKASQ